jgi:hypothetical protein
LKLRIHPVASGFRPAAAALLVWISVLGAGAEAARLVPEAVAGWSAYVSATENRVQRELESPRGFLAMDFLEPEAAAAERRQVLGEGVVLMRKMQSSNPQGRRMTVPGALVHHWRGAVFIPGVTVRQVLLDLQSHAPEQEDVLRSAILERGPDRMRVYIRMQRRKLVTVTYNTEHVVTFSRFGVTRASSVSTATRIAEVSDPDTSDERELPPGDDRGFLWRLNAYWRYEEVAGGVIAECESISLSRDVPSFLRYLVSPLVESTARESMERTLVTLRSRFASRVAH